MREVLERWSKNAGPLAAWGLITYATTIAAGWAAYVILQPLGTMVRDSISAMIMLLAYSIMGTSIARSASDGKPTSFEKIWDDLKAYWLDVGIGVIYSWLPLLAGILIGLAIATYAVVTKSAALAAISLVIAAVGWLSLFAVAVAPYISAKKGWEAAIHESWKVGRKNYITLLVAGIGYTIIYITYLAALASPLGWILGLADAVLVMHIRNMTYYEIIRSAQARE